MDTSDQQTFPWILIRYIRGRSDQNEVSRKSEVSLVQIRIERDQNEVSPRQSFIVTYCKLL
jgi:hypothetical protein